MSSYDNDGNAVTLLNKNVSWVIILTLIWRALWNVDCYKVEQVKMASWDTADNWQHLPTIAYKDSSGNYIDHQSASTIAYTGQTLHFSVFNPIKGSDGLRLPRRPMWRQSRATPRLPLRQRRPLMLMAALQRFVGL